MEKFIEILKAALTKFSAINMTQFVGICTLIITSWQGANLIDSAMVLLLTSALTLILKLWQSSKELVSTGFNLDWTVWVSGIGGMVIGFFDSFISNGAIMSWLFGDKVNMSSYDLYGYHDFLTHRILLTNLLKVLLLVNWANE
jgi:hypothetical protein